MASVASPGYIKPKRGHSMISPIENEYEKKIKRRRMINCATNNNNMTLSSGSAPLNHNNNLHEKDVLRYSQRHVEVFEHHKQAEIHKLKQEYEQYIMKKDEETRTVIEENKKMKNCYMDMEKMTAENKILKRAVSIQNQQKEQVILENKALKQIAHQAAEHIKKLEQSNYALKIHLQNTNSNASGLTYNPDVY